MTNQQWAAAIIPFSWNEHTPVFQRPIVMSNDANKAERKHFLEALLDIPWLEPEIRRAVMKQLGRSPQAENKAEATGWKQVMERLINEVEAKVQEKTGKRSRGAVRERIADRTGANSESLRKRLQRLNK